MPTQEVLIAETSVQPGSRTSLYTQLIEKRPLITVDENGGLSVKSARHAGAHTLVSGINWGKSRSSGGYTA